MPPKVRLESGKKKSNGSTNANDKKKNQAKADSLSMNAGWLIVGGHRFLISTGSWPQICSHHTQILLSHKLTSENKNSSQKQWERY
jgi:hypothetical protein